MRGGSGIVLHSRHNALVNQLPSSSTHSLTRVFHTSTTKKTTSAWQHMVEELLICTIEHRSQLRYSQYAAAAATAGDHEL